MSLLQLTLEENFLDKLKRIAASKGVSAQNFAKYIIAERLKEEDDEMITENGFTKKEEKRILKSFQSLQEEKKGKELESLPVDTFLDRLPA